MTLQAGRAVILTGHFAVQKRRANILWLSDELRAQGWHVTIVSVGYSWVSRLRGDRRFLSLYDRPRSGRHVVDDTLINIFHYAPIHPFSFRSDGVDRLIRPVHRLFETFWRPRLKQPLKDADLVVVESGPPVMLAPDVARLARKAVLVYRVSDDVNLLGLPKFVRRAELRNAPLFDRISMASPVLAKVFDGFPTVAIDPVGVPSALYQSALPDPFGSRRAAREVVCAGTTQFDIQAVLAIARLRPGWQLHVLGRLRQAVPADAPSNIVFHHEQPFEKAAAFIKHADIGLAPYLDKPGVEYQTHQSNRVMQYRYVGLPIIGPKRLCHSSVPSIFGYEDLSERALAPVLDQAERYVAPDRETIPDWHDLYLRIVSTHKQTKSAGGTAGLPRML